MPSAAVPSELKERNLAGLRGASGFTLVESALADADLSTLLNGITHVFHLAAQSGVRRSDAYRSKACGTHLSDRAFLAPGCQGYINEAVDPLPSRPTEHGDRDLSERRPPADGGCCAGMLFLRNVFVAGLL